MKSAPRIQKEEDRNVVRLFMVLVFVFVLMTALKPNIFLRPGNFESMAFQFPEYGIMAIGVSLAMISGGIDLAVVGTANLSAIFAAKYLIAMVPNGASQAQVLGAIGVAVILALLVGLTAGAFSGLLVSHFDSAHTRDLGHPTALHRVRHRLDLRSSPLAFALYTLR